MRNSHFATLLSALMLAATAHDGHTLKACPSPHCLRRKKPLTRYATQSFREQHESPRTGASPNWQMRAMFSGAVGTGDVPKRPDAVRQQFVSNAQPETGVGCDDDQCNARV